MWSIGTPLNSASLSGSSTIPLIAESCRLILSVPTSSCTSGVVIVSASDIGFITRGFSSGLLSLGSNSSGYSPTAA